MRVILASVLLYGLAAAASVAAHPPYCLVVDQAGNAYFSDLETVWRLAPDGRLSIFRPGVPDTHVHELALAPDGAIEGDQNRYDSGTQRFYSGLWRRTATGAERLIVPMTEQPPAGFGVWQDKAGNRYTAQWRSNTDRRTVLLRRRPDGRVDVLFDAAPRAPRPLQPSVASVGGMAFGVDGDVFFADGGALRRIASNRTVTKPYSGVRGSALRGLAVTRDGSVVAADMGTKEVLKVQADGAVTTLYRETAAWLPTAVSLVGNRLLVLEANADPYQYDDRVRVIEVTSGRGRVIASPAHYGVASAPRPSPLQTKGGGASAPLILFTGLVTLVALLGAWRLNRLRQPSN